MRWNPCRSLLPLAALAAAFVWPQASHAQDFLFRQPVVVLTLRAGPNLYTAGGDLFDDIRSRLTLDKSDFRSVTVGGDIVVIATDRIDVVGSIMYSQFESPSEFREWTEWDGEKEIPIEQTTLLRTVPISLSVRYQVLGRGRRISQLAYIPRRTTPYVGAGVGLTSYRLEQVGDFVDEQEDPPPIFTDFFETSGATATFHALAGLDHWFARAVGLNVEARYSHGSAKPDYRYENYDKLDLGGLQATLGISVRW